MVSTAGIAKEKGRIGPKWPSEIETSARRQPEQSRSILEDFRQCIKEARSVTSHIIRSESALRQKVALLRLVNEARDSFGAMKSALLYELTPYISSLENMEFEQPSLMQVYTQGIITTLGITSSEKMFRGKPCLEGTRIPVELVLRYLAVGDDPIEDLHINKDDVKSCLEFAAIVCGQRVFPDA